MVDPQGGRGASHRVRPRTVFPGRTAVKGRLVLALLLPTLLLSACRWPAPRWDVDEGEPERIERGRYLAEHVAICATCHGQRDWSHYGAPIADGTAGHGGDSYSFLFDLPDDIDIVAPNITPLALAGWTDGEVIRAVRGGLSRDGRALFLTHPFNNYRSLRRDDLEGVVAWLRALPAGGELVPPTDWKYRVLKDIVASFPSPASTPGGEPEAGSVARGRYLVRLGSCMWCHSPIDPLGWPIAGREWTGGQPFAVHEPGGGTAYSTNLTPHATGLGGWSREQFIDRFRRTTPELVRTSTVAPGGFNSPMAWSAYAGMTEQDLGAIYDFLRSLPARKGLHPRWLPPGTSP